MFSSRNFHKLIFKISLSIGCLVLFIVLVPGNVIAQEETWNVYENATLGFKISYPPNWVYVETNEQLDKFSSLEGVVFTPVTEIGFQGGPSEPGIVFYVLEFRTPIRNLPLSYFTNNSQHIFMNIPNTTFLSNETIILKNNISAFSVNLTSNNEDVQNSGSFITISKSPDVFFAGYTASPTKWLKYHTIIQNMINSLEFVP
jgi:hypothetical protein